MHVIICGGRDYGRLSNGWYGWTEEDFTWLDHLGLDLGITKVFSGGAKGADRLGETWAESHNLDLEIVKTGWKTYGKAVGMVKKLLEGHGEKGVISFPGGIGTHMVRGVGREAGIPIYEVGTPGTSIPMFPKRKVVIW